LKGKLYATTPHYDNAVAEKAAEVEEVAIPAPQDFSNVNVVVNSPEVSVNIESGENAINVDESEDIDEDVVTDDVEDEEVESEEDYEEEGEDEISLQEENAALLAEVERLNLEVGRLTPFADKYLANKDLIDSIETKVAEGRAAAQAEIEKLNSHIDRIKAVVLQVE